MNILKRKQNLMRAIALAAVFALLSSTNAYAQKKPGGGGGGNTPVPAGTIHFYGAGCWTMAADGTNKQQTPCMGIPSHQLHAGYRWFLSTLPNPITDANELVVVRDDGQSESVIYTGIAAESAFRARWAKDDSFISFSGGPTPFVVGSENGIYAAELDWDEVGVPTLMTEFVPAITGTFTDSGPELSPWFDWSPDGSSVVYVRWTEGLTGTEPLLTVSNLETGTTKILAISSGAMEWSPDGTRIAIRLREWNSSGIYTIAPDASNLLQITKDGNSTNDFLPVWSPDSKYLVFGRQKMTTKGFTNSVTGDVLRVLSTGGSTVNLTGDMSYDGTKRPNAWR